MRLSFSSKDVFQECLKHMKKSQTFIQIKEVWVWVFFLKRLLLFMKLFGYKYLPPSK